MKQLLAVLLALTTALTSVSVWADLTPGSMDMQWDAGAEDCTAPTRSPIQVQRYNSTTFILRENLCVTWEAPFMYLLVGSKQALLIDTGDVANATSMPLATTVMGLLPHDPQLPLIVVHSHGHLDHREGDAQFDHLANVRLVTSDLEHVRTYFGFTDWPNGLAQIDLGDRIVDVLPAPGHHPAHVVYYDRNTGIVFSGDFLLPGRLLVDDFDAYQASARRVADFVKDRPISQVLGGHIEKNRGGELFTWQSSDHRDERALPLTKADVLALPAALSKFNGFYTETGDFIIENPLRNLIAFAITAIVILIALGVLLYRFIRRRRTANKTKRSRLVAG
jgi:hydroxyacylglutathione hydrolase